MELRLTCTECITSTCSEPLARDFPSGKIICFRAVIPELPIIRKTAKTVRFFLKKATKKLQSNPTDVSHM